MSKMKIIIISLTFCLFVIFTAKVSAETFTRRLAGNDRYETASEVIQYGWPDESTYAILAGGTDYNDALVAAPLAKKYNAPVIITDGDKLNDNAIIELKRLNVKDVFIIGGEAAVSQSVEDTLNKMDITYTRISGDDRYSTAVEVAKKLGTVNEVFMTEGNSPEDALSLSSIAGEKKMPILFTAQNQIPAVVKQYLNEQNIRKVYVIGGTDIISNEAVNDISGVVRIAGKDAYERNINIIDKFIKELDLSNIYVASGEDLTGAPVGAALAAKFSSPVMLISEGHTDSSINFIKNRSILTSNINILGGEDAVPLNLLKKVFGNAANYPQEEDAQYIKNISSGSCILQGDWIYYSSFNKQDTDGLYKIKPDGSSKVCLDAGIISNVYIDGETIYYNNSNKFYTIEIDGTNKRLFSDELVSFIKVRGEWIYYSNSKGIFKVKKDGSGMKVLVLGYVDSIRMDGNYIDYNYAIKDMICRIDINGDNYKVIESSPSYILFEDNDYIYYKDYYLGKYYKILKSGQGKSVIGSDEMAKIKANIDNELIITYNYPVYNGENIHLKYGELYLVFNKDIMKCNDVEKISLTDEAGEIIDIKEAAPRSELESTFVITPEENLKNGTEYTLFIPQGTIQSEDGELYNRYINIKFKMENS